MIAKAQSAVEYLMIIALTLGIIVPTSYLFFRYSSESNVQIVDVQISQIGRNIMDTAETVYFSGESSKIVLEINMPENVVDVYILANRELVFEVSTEIGETDVVFFSDVPIAEDGDLSDIAGFGSKKVKIQSDGNQALIGKFTG
mgnify:CR=1 FL=1|jgi:hypothetical protein|tara:strand:+ start:548 stop:979 length:432 start_codon:yes stop_codon:yes gene_type:complete